MNIETIIEANIDKYSKSGLLNLDSYISLDEVYKQYTSMTDEQIDEAILKTDIPGLFVVQEAGILNGITQTIGKGYDSLKQGAQNVANSAGKTFDTKQYNAMNSPLIAVLKANTWHFYIFKDLDVTRPGHKEVLQTLAKELSAGAEKVQVVPANDPLRQSASTANTTEFKFPTNDQKTALLNMLNQLQQVINLSAKEYTQVGYVSPQELDVFKAKIANAVGTISKQIDAAKQVDQTQVAAAATQVEKVADATQPATAPQPAATAQLSGAQQTNTGGLQTGVPSIAPQSTSGGIGQAITNATTVPSMGAPMVAQPTVTQVPAESPNDTYQNPGAPAQVTNPNTAVAANTASPVNGPSTFTFNPNQAGFTNPQQAVYQGGKKA